MRNLILEGMYFTSLALQSRFKDPLVKRYLAVLLLLTHPGDKSYWATSGEDHNESLGGFFI